MRGHRAHAPRQRRQQDRSAFLEVEVRADPVGAQAVQRAAQRPLVRRRAGGDGEQSVRVDLQRGGDLVDGLRIPSVGGEQLRDEPVPLAFRSRASTAASSR
ncbi:hypothetical protein ACFQ0O_16850 [Saccharopolyspora spinosporotrichia]